MSAQKTVYLAGPISGLNFGQCDDWRQRAMTCLAESGIRGLSPLRCKEYLDSVGVLSGHGREYAHLNVLSRPRGVMTRDRFDATRCDVLLVNLLDAERVSIGTVMEIAWADLSRIPIVAVMKDEGCVHDHMMIHEAVGFRVSTLEEGMTIVKAILQ
jgi:nucleoside 2-deoxyribosyltransferase